MQISGLVHDCRGKRWPVLTAELTMQVLLAGPDPDREPRQLMVAALQQRGLERIAQPGALPRALPHWSATVRTAVDDTIDVQVRSGDGPAFFDGTATVFTADWFTVAAGHRGCVLFAGAGLTSAAGTVTTESLHDAARRGTLLGARILLR